MGKGAGQSHSAEQRELRRRRGEPAFLFDKGPVALSCRVRARGVGVGLVIMWR